MAKHLIPCYKGEYEGELFWDDEEQKVYELRPLGFGFAEVKGASFELGRGIYHKEVEPLPTPGKDTLIKQHVQAILELLA